MTFRMRTVTNLARVTAPRRGTVIALGTFDGVHAGHRAVIGGVVKDAARRRATSTVVTFDPLPSVVLGKRSDPAVLTPFPVRIGLLRSLGVELCVVVPFTRAMARTPAEAFVERVLVKRLAARCVFVGEGYRFGKGREGCVRMLARLGRECGFELVVVKPVSVAGRKVSSTAIRQLVGRGALAGAAKLLGRPYSISGCVVQGKRRGRGMGYPTANIFTGQQLLPPDGVYAGRARAGRLERQAMLYIGVQPTFRRGARAARRVEVHMLDLTRDLYGRTVEFEFAARLRGEQVFPGPGELAAQMARDEKRARRILGEAPYMSSRSHRPEFAKPRTRVCEATDPSLRSKL